MTEVLIVRHAYAGDREKFKKRSDLPDEARPLTRKGIKQMKKNVEGMCKIWKNVSAIYTSPLVRAKETAEIVAKGYRFGSKKIRTTDVLRPDAEVSEFVKWLSHLKPSSKKDSGKPVVVVGHEPQLGKLVSFLLLGERQSAVEFEKGAICSLGFEGAIKEGRAKLLCFVRPSELKKIGKDR